MKASDLNKLSDRDLVAALRIFNQGTTGNEASFSLTGAMSGNLKTKIDAFEAGLDTLDAARAAEDAAVVAKDDLRKDAVGEARQQMKLTRATPGIKSDDLASVGLDEYDTTPTDSPSPSSAPFGLIEYAKLKHIIHFRDSNTPDSEAKPKGMLGCEIYRHIGNAPPASEADFDFVTLDTGSPYVAFYTMADAGKKVYYILRWKSKNGETGEWSETIEATING